MRVRATPPLLLLPGRRTPAGYKRPFHQFYTCEEVTHNLKDWEKTARRLVLGERLGGRGLRITGWPPGLSNDCGAPPGAG